MQGRFKMEYRLFTIVRYNYRDYNTHAHALIFIFLRNSTIQSYGGGNLIFRALPLLPVPPNCILAAQRSATVQSKGII